MSGAERKIAPLIATYTTKITGLKQKAGVSG